MASYIPASGDVIDGKYRIDALIGRGGFGSVYGATHALTGKRVALKWMDPEVCKSPENAQRFIREARIASRIDHPNVVQVHDVGPERGGLYMVMELLHGQPLSALFAKGPVEPTLLLGLLMPALRGIAAAHARLVVHRDLKPDNIFLCAGRDDTPGEAKVLDFGISKATAGADASLLSQALTQTGSILGTPFYMAPEQVMGDRDLDPRTDVHALGVILFQGLTGQLPFRADVYSALVVKIATDPAPEILSVKPDIPPALAAVVMRALAKRKEDRYPDVAALARDLEPFSGGVPFSTTARNATLAAQVTATPVTVVTPGAVTTPLSTETSVTLPPARGRGFALGALAAIVLAGGAAGLYAAFGPGGGGAEEERGPASAPGDPAATGATGSAGGESDNAASATAPPGEAPPAEVPTAEAPTAEAPTAEAPTAEAPTAEMTESTVVESPRIRTRRPRPAEPPRMVEAPRMVEERPDPIRPPGPAVMVDDF